MNRSHFALFVAILVHLLLFLLLYITINKMPKVEQKHQEERIKISLKDLPKQKKIKSAGVIKKKVKPPKIAPPMPKGSQLKKIVKSKKIKPKNQIHKHSSIKPITPIKPYIFHTKKLEQNRTKKIEKKVPKVDKQLSWLYEDHSNEEQQEQKKNPSDSSSISQDIKKLYGEEFGKLTPGEQKYILDNQEIMRRITQQILNRVARVNIPRNLNINASNIIEFKLHPNGDMSDFRFISKSGYYILDDTTKETIEYAYSKYPLPKETTLIRYNVFYNLAQY